MECAMHSDDSLLVPIWNGNVSAKLGGLGRSKIYKLIDEGELLRVNIGRRAFVTRQSIDDYVSRLAAEATVQK
jgi:excisionase family DNA binding protein